jgi:multimeric flavodoxin WrbA
MNYLFLLGSTRAGGNTEALARLAAEQLPADVKQTWLRLSDLPIEPFKDIRHEGDGVYPAPEGNERLLLESTLEATDLVIASPLYWFTVSTSVKSYLDYWSAWMRVPGRRLPESDARQDHVVDHGAYGQGSRAGRPDAGHTAADR